MATIAREASVTYGSYIVGGAQTKRILRDIMTSDDGYEHAVVDFTFTVVGDDTTDFATECAAAEAAFHIPHQNLTVAGLGSRSFSHSARTGFNAVPSVQKIGHPMDSGLSRTYRARVEVGRPADVGGTSGRRLTRTQINVAYGPQRRRTVTITGEWTGIGGTSARSTYEGQITTYGNTITSSLGGTYKIQHEPQTTQDDANNVIRIAIVYEEILDTQVGGSNADIRQESVILTRTDSQPGDSPLSGGTNVVRLGTIVARYDAYVEKNAGGVKSMWDTIRTRIISLARTTYGLGSVVVIDESPNYDFTDSHLTATMTLQGFPGSKVVECSVEVSHDTEEGHVLVPVWNGNPFARYKYQGPIAEIRTVHITQTIVGHAFKLAGEPFLFQDPNPDRGELIKKRSTVSAHPYVVGGARSNSTEKMTRITEVRVFERAKIIKKGGSNNDVATPSGGNAGATGPGLGSTPTPFDS